MAEIIKGAQYSVPIVVRKNGELVTPDNVDGIRIALGNQVARYPDGNLEYSSGDEAWLFPMSQENTYSLIGMTVSYQVQIKIGDAIYPDDIRTVKLKETMFKERWE